MVADTLAIVRRLEAVGVDRDVAEAHAAAIQTAVDDRQDHLATTADLARVESRIAALEASIEGRFAVLEARLTWRMIGLQIAAVGLIIAGLKFIS